MAAVPCPICGAGTAPTLVPVQVRRGGRLAFRLEVRARACPDCGYVDVSDTAREELIATLERRTQPGDDIVFPVED